MCTSTNEEFIRKNQMIIVDDDKNTQLHYAAAFGDVEQVQQELAKGGKIDPENFLGWTPLMMALRHNNVNVVNWLIDNRADATKHNKFGISVFLLSVTSGNLELMQAILRHLLCGGVSRQFMERVLSPISLAILFGYDHIFKYLLSHQTFDLNAATSLEGITPLMFAAALGNAKAIKKLIAKGANPALKNYLGRTAQDITTLKCRSEDIDTLPSSKAAPVPVIVIHSPYSPYNPYLQLASCSNYCRKSSNVGPADYMCSPDLSPFTPVAMMPQQVFFPPELTPGAYTANAQGCSPNDMLNAKILGEQSAFFSPVNQICYPHYG